MAPRIFWHIKYHTRQTRKKLSKPLVHATAWMIGLLYYIYMALVWHTSRVESYGMGRGVKAVNTHGNIVIAIWHDNAILAGRCCRVFSPTTLASRSDIGEVITKVLKRQRYHVFRGGSSRGKARRKPVLQQLVGYLNKRKEVVLALTVDGSHGPARVMKPGIIGLAMETDMPIFAIHIACKPVLHLKTWDRTRIPLPFGKIVMVLEGPILKKKDSAEGEEFERMRSQAQLLLADTAERADRCLKGEPLSPPDERLALDPSYGDRGRRVGRALLLPSEPPPRPRLIEEDGKER